MKIIISHDVDHIDARDHLFKDLILEKMIIRSVLQILQCKISFKTFFHRVTMLFRGRMNRINEVMEFDKKQGIPSTFFFGMANGLGMSYSRNKAARYIKMVKEADFDVGVHGVEYISEKKICEEHDLFKNISGLESFGIRNHYVRFDAETFSKMDRAGYCYDTTFFNKKKTEFLNPYKIGNMWEFPLHIMDGYVCEQGKLKEGLENTYKIIDEAEKRDVKFLTILFHDYQFDDGFDPQLKKWYINTIEYCKARGYEFVSYHDAIEELENG